MKATARLLGMTVKVVVDVEAVVVWMIKLIKVS